MSIKIVTSRTLVTGTYSLTVKDLEELIEGLSPELKIQVSFYKADTRDQRDHDQLTLRVNVDQEIKQ